MITHYKIMHLQARLTRDVHLMFTVEILMSMHFGISKRERNYFVIMANSLVSTFWSLRSGSGLVCEK